MTQTDDELVADILTKAGFVFLDKPDGSTSALKPKRPNYAAEYDSESQRERNTKIGRFG